MRPHFAIIVLLLSFISSSSWSADFDKGFGAAQSGDFETALREWTPLAEQGSAQAQFNLAKIYREGKGVSKDYKAAVKWFSLSAEQGNASAQYHLGVAYSYGLGVVPNYEIALKWYRRSAEQGNAFAQHHLSLLYYFGNGLLEDKVYAHMWANLAYTNGFEMAKQLRQVLTEQMTPSQIDAALSLARVCKNRNLNGC